MLGQYASSFNGFRGDVGLQRSSTSVFSCPRPIIKVDTLYLTPSQLKSYYQNFHKINQLLVADDEVRGMYKQLHPYEQALFARLSVKQILFCLYLQELPRVRLFLKLSTQKRHLVVNLSVQAPEILDRMICIGLPDLFLTFSKKELKYYVDKIGQDYLVPNEVLKSLVTLPLEVRNVIMKACYKPLYVLANTLSDEKPSTAEDEVVILR